MENVESFEKLDAGQPIQDAELPKVVMINATKEEQEQSPTLSQYVTFGFRSRGGPLR